MLNIQINNPELEDSIQQTFGDDTALLAQAFSHFIRHYKIRQDIEISGRQLDKGEAIALSDAIAEVRVKYE